MKKINAKRVISLLISVSVIITIFCLNSVTSNAASYNCTNERMQYYINQYEGAYWNSSYHGAYKCKGFADMMFNEIYGTGPIGGYNDGYHYYLPDHYGATEVARTSKASYSDIYDMMHLAKSGNYIQWSRGYSQHSALFVSCDEEGFYVFDCNYISPNICGVHYITYSKIASTNYGISIYASVTDPLPVTWKSEKTTAKSETTTKKIEKETASRQTEATTVETTVAETTTVAEIIEPVVIDEKLEDALKLCFFETYSLDLGNGVEKYTSSDENIVTVSEDGVVSAVSAGSAVITALLKDGTSLDFDVNVSLLSYKTIIDVLFSDFGLHESIANAI